MVQINFAQKQVNAKVVYYGPGMSGKTTNLEIIHQRAPEQNRGDLTSISTDGDRTLFFDFMPLDLGTVAGMRTCFQIYTVPGQVYYNSTRKLVLQGVDGVVFVADSSAAMVEENLESMRNLEENLNEYGKSLAEMPLVIQYNKRDLPDALPIEELEQLLNPQGVPAYEGVANTGQGVFPTLKALAGSVLEQIHQSYGSQSAASGGQDQEISSGTTGFYQAQQQPQQPQQPVAPQQPVNAQPAPNVAQPVQQPVQPAAQQQPVQQQPQPMQHQPAVQVQQPVQGQPQQPVQPAAQNIGGDPMAKTTVHGPPQPSGAQEQEGQGLQLRMARTPVAGQQGPQNPALHQTGMHQVATQQATMQQPQAAPQTNAYSQAQQMQVDPGQVAPNAQNVSNARSFPVSQPGAQPNPRLRPRATARATQSSGGGKSAMFTGLFVVAALGAGAVLGRLVLSIF